MSDLISREEVIKNIKWHKEEVGKVAYGKAKELFDMAHDQIVDMLERERVIPTAYNVQAERNKAIDDFAKAIKSSPNAEIWCCKDVILEFCSGDDCEGCMEKFKEQIDGIAEQMKGGVDHE